MTISNLQKNCLTLNSSNVFVASLDDAESKTLSVTSATSSHLWSNLMWVLFPEKEH